MFRPLGIEIRCPSDQHSSIDIQRAEGVSREIGAIAQRLCQHRKLPRDIGHRLGLDAGCRALIRGIALGVIHP